MGKIFHPGAASGGDDPLSWSVPYYRPRNKPYWSSTSRSWYAVSPDERRKLPLPDEQVTTYAINQLRDLAPRARTGEKPFFMALGFYKPHLPFVFPAEFLGAYPPANIHLPPNPYAPENMPTIAWSQYGELRSYDDIARLGVTGEVNTTLPHDVTLQLRRAYYSSVSYIDYLVGTILAELNRLGLDHSTIVSFVGDHGWSLGENGQWTKHTNFEQVTSLIFIFGDPTAGIQLDNRYIWVWMVVII